jgi:galactonate dehydratase
MPLKITGVNVHLLHRYLYVEVQTDAGITGIGESGAWGFLESTAAAVEKFARYLIGEDPLRIEHHWQYMYRASHFRGSAVMGAISALDVALWDIAGKHYGEPVYRLLGGPVRDRARCYHHVFGETRAELLDGILEAKAEGYTAVGHLTPFLDEPRDRRYHPKSYVAKITDAIQAVAQYREAVGDDVDLCIEIHRRLTPAEAVTLGRAIEPFHPFFYEDPVTPDNFDEMAYVASKIGIPIATGERMTSLWEFQMLLARNAVQYVRPNVGLVGGISGAKKIATLAEAHHVGVVPHNPLSPVSTATGLQLAGCIPNFALQEYPGKEHSPPKSLLVDSPVEHDGKGYLMIPTSPGIGISLRPDASEHVSKVTRETVTRLHYDGSVVDQ